MNTDVKIERVLNGFLVEYGGVCGQKEIYLNWDDAVKNAKLFLDGKKGVPERFPYRHCEGCAEAAKKAADGTK